MLSVTAIALLCFGIGSNALSCSMQYQCNPVSEDYSYVSCTEGVCQCRSEFGFSGTATEEDKCRCDEGTVFWGAGNPHCKPCDSSSIIYEDGIPYCVNPASCEAQDELIAKEEIRRGVITDLYNKLVYPIPVDIVENMNIEGIFTQDVRGRVTPVGFFENIEGSVEYFFGLATSPGAPVVDVFIIDLVLEDDRAAVRVDILFNFTDRSQVRNITQTGFYTFNEDNLISSYDLAILRGGQANDQPELPHGPFIQGLCNTIQQNCEVGGPYEEYPSVQGCIDHLNSIEYGTWENPASNTVICRLLHVVLTPHRPEIHCPHVGPGGGGKCVDFTYEDWYNEYY